MKILRPLLVCVLLALPASAADYYWSASGSGSGCTSGAPCSFSTAQANAVNPGDRMIAKAGTYTSHYQTIGSANGTAENPIEFTCETQYGCTFTGIIKFDSEYWKVTDCIFERIEFLSTANYATVTGNRIQPRVSGSGLDILADYCSITNNLWTNYNINAQMGLNVTSGTEGTLIAWNTWEDNKGRDCMRVYGRDQLIRSNIFRNLTNGPQNGHSDHTDILQYTETGSQTASNIVFEANFITNSPVQLANLKNDLGNSPAGWFYFRNNLFVQSHVQVNAYVNDVWFVNNTAFNFSDDILLRFADGAAGTATDGRAQNNLCIRVGGNEAVTIEIAGGIGVIESHNMLTDADDTAKTSVLLGEGGINGGYSPDDIFTDWENGDFSLKAGSPAIGSGVNLSEFFDGDYYGNTRSASDPWDMGAIAYNATPAPSAPSTISATAVDFSRINLSWENVADESGYKIERSTTSGSGFAQIATTGADVNAYQDTGLAESTTYYYRVRAYNAGGNSSYTSEDSATTSAASPPPAASGSGRRVRGAVTGAGGGIAP